MSEEEKLLEEGKWYLARQLLPDAIIYCRHDMAPNCECVTHFDVDKRSPLTEREATVAAALFELKKMKRLNIQDDQQHNLLIQITQWKEDDEDIPIEIYESTYPSLLPKKVSQTDVPPQIDHSDSPTKDIDQAGSNPHIPPRKHNPLKYILAALVLLMLLITIVALYFWII